MELLLKIKAIGGRTNLGEGDNVNIRWMMAECHWNYFFSILFY